MIRIAHVATIDLTHRFLLLPQLRRLRAEGYDVTAISAPGPHAAALEAEGIRHVPLRSATRAWDPAADLRLLKELYDLFRRERFDLVHTHNPKPGVIGRPAARAAGVPVVVNTVHGFYATPTDPARRRVPVMALERAAARFSDLELYQSAEDLRWAVRSGLVPASRARYVGNGIDLRRFDPDRVSADRTAELRTELGIPDGTLVVGTVGRLVAEKGFHELLLAAGEVRRRFPEVRFMAVGPDDAVKADAITAADLNGQLICTGFRTDIEDLLPLMDVFVLPSWREGFPRSAIEAGAMARPRIVTDIRGCREAVRDGVDGLLIPVRDAGALAASIIRLLEDPEERIRLGRRAKEIAVERFDEERIGDVIVRGYHDLLTERGVTGRALAPPLDGIVIRAARPKDVPSIVRLHADDLPTAFHTSLGPGFARQLFMAQVRDPSCVILVAERAGEIVGYVSGMLSMRRFLRRFAVRRGVPAGLAAAPALARPGAIRQVFETLAYPDQTAGLPEAECAFIGVRRGIPPGLGLQLCRGMVEGLGKKGARRAKGIVGKDNVPMNFMVRRLGFQLRREIVLHDGSVNLVYEIECPQPSPAS
jgi:glycosyltransferase involved in cell wall biosynthesis/ribosomal protein S18 acetylase RimI-like enzyme